MATYLALAPVPAQVKILMTALIDLKGRRRKNGGNVHAVAVLTAAVQTLIGAERGGIAVDTAQITPGRVLLGTETGTGTRVGMSASIGKEVVTVIGEKTGRK